MEPGSGRLTTIGGTGLAPAQTAMETPAQQDGWIVGAAENWRVERMATVDRNILRLAIHELLDDERTPPPVIIDEAVAVAKRFGSGDSGGFINGVLDSIRRQLEKEPPDGTGARQT